MAIATPDKFTPYESATKLIVARGKQLEQMIKRRTKDDKIPLDYPISVRVNRLNHMLFSNQCKVKGLEVGAVIRSLMFKFAKGQISITREEIDNYEYK